MKKIPYLLIIFFLIIYGLLIRTIYLFKQDNRTQKEISITPNKIEEQSETINDNPISSEIKGERKSLSKKVFSNGCDAGTGIKYVTLASNDNRFYTNKSKKVETKTISISGDLGTVYLCIIPDISDKEESYNSYRKYQSYNAVTYIKVGGYEGYYDVGITKDHNNFYDSDSNNKIPVKKGIYGKYWTHELPLVQLIDTSKNTIIADIETEGTKEIYLGSEFKDGKTINIGAFMTALGENNYWASSIKEFKILRDGEGSIEIK